MVEKRRPRVTSERRPDMCVEEARKSYKRTAGG
jgi:hypothetical protein